MTPSPIRRRHVLAVAFTLALMPLASEAAQDPEGAARIAAAVTRGDAVIVTRWSGGKVEGKVVDTTACALVLRTGQLTWALPLADVKTLRRREARPDAPAARAMRDVASQCDDVTCLPAALGVLGIGALFQRVDNLGHPPKVVYRASRRPAAVGTCPGPGPT